MCVGEGGGGGGGITYMYYVCVMNVHSIGVRQIKWAGQEGGVNIPQSSASARTDREVD